MVAINQPELKTPKFILRAVQVGTSHLVFLVIANRPSQARVVARCTAYAPRLSTRGHSVQTLLQWVLALIAWACAASIISTINSAKGTLSGLDLNFTGILYSAGINWGYNQSAWGFLVRNWEGNRKGLAVGVGRGRGDCRWVCLGA
jgi:hypothetical protein